MKPGLCGVLLFGVALGVSWVEASALRSARLRPKRELHLASTVLRGAHNASVDHNVSDGQWPAAVSGGVIHFLFLATSGIPHATEWQHFFSEGPRTNWRAYVHCKDPTACTASGLSTKLPQVEMVPTVPSWYCHDLVTAMAQLLKVAIQKSPANGGHPTVEKFVFISDSTLPAKPFSVVHSTLASNDDTDICMFPQDQWGTATIDNVPVRLVKHHQWVILNRQHAELFVKDWRPVDGRAVWHVPLKGGSWTGRERNLSPQHFSRSPNSNSCTDEWAFFATIFGVFEPDATGARSYPHLGTVSQSPPYGSSPQGRCRTFTFWDTNGQDFAQLGGQIASDPGSRLSCYPKCWQHPAGFEQLSDRGLHALRASPFLFVRKMSPQLWIPNFYGIVLSTGAQNATLR